MRHPSSEELVSYLAGDAEDEADLEAHVFECGACTAEAERLAPVTAALRREIPPVLDRARLAAVRARGLRLQDNPVSPGEHNVVTFPGNVDLLLHRLRSLKLDGATRVDVVVRVESTGRPLLELPDAPFDPDAGEVIVACQRHFSELPPDTQMEVRVHAPQGEQVQRYSILHRFEV